MTAPAPMPPVEINPPDFTDFAAVRGLICAAYAHMDGRIDPPSFIHHMTVRDVDAKAQAEDFYLVRDGARLIAVGFGHGLGAAYELGKLAVAAADRGRGIGRRMIEAAAERARATGHTALQLYARVELTENHRIYRALDFDIAGTMAHPGFERPTAYLFRRRL